MHGNVGRYGTVFVVVGTVVVIGVGPRPVVVVVGVILVESVLWRRVVFGVSKVRSAAVLSRGLCDVGRCLFGRTSLLTRLEKTLRHRRFRFGGDFYGLGVLGHLATNLGHHAVHGGVALVRDKVGVLEITVVFHVLDHILLEVGRLVVQKLGVDHQLQMLLILVEVLVGRVGHGRRSGRSRCIRRRRRRLFGHRLVQLEVGRFDGPVLVHPARRRSRLLGEFDQLHSRHVCVLDDVLLYIYH